MGPVRPMASHRLLPRSTLKRRHCGAIAGTYDPQTERLVGPRAPDEVVTAGTRVGDSAGLLACRVDDHTVRARAACM